MPYSEKWLACISHLLNTLMKHVMNDTQRVEGVVWKDLVRVKTIAQVFKHGNWNTLLHSGFALI